MKLQDLKRIEEAPRQGNLLVYTRQEVLLQRYEDRQNLEAILSEKELLELHLFDAQKEYRCIVSESRRFCDVNGIIEAVIDFPEKDDNSVYREEVLLEDSDGTITVLNHIAYKENGMAYVDNYRLQM